MAAPKEELSIEWWDIDRPQPYGPNPVRHTDKDVNKIATSIKAFGWRQPIVVDEEGVIIIGHGRLLAAQQLKRKRVPIHVAVGLSPERVKALRLADNRVGQEAGWDYELLNIELEELHGLDFDMLTLGFDTDELSGLLDGERMPGQGDAETEMPDESWGVIIVCTDEREQTELLDRFLAEGLNVKSLMG